MRVLHLFKTYPPDSFTGVERVIWEIAEGTAASGVVSDVLTLSAAPADRPLVNGHHHVHQARQLLYVASTGLSVSAFSMFRRLAASADIVHYHFPWPMMDLLHFAVRHGKPSVLTYHSDVVRQVRLQRLYRPVMERFLNSVDRIVATSPNYLASSPVLQGLRHKTEVIPIGLSRRQPPDEARLRHWRQRLGEQPFFLFVGALRYYKGLGDLLGAARRTGMPVVIVGDGEMRSEIEAARPGNVTLLGALDDADKEALLSLCLAFVFPSHVRSEAYGLALVEAARAGRPMISCELGTGTSYVNQHGSTGLVVPPGDPARLADAMLQLWADEALASSMGEAAGRRFETHLTSQEMADRYEALYRKLLSSHAV